MTNSSGNIDKFLQWWVTSANKIQESTTEVTLCVGGLMITGEIIGAQTYARLNSSDSSPQEAKDVFKDLAVDPSQEDQLIHLSNANIILSSGFQVPAQGYINWRGRLDSVDGWFFGRLSSQ